MSKGSFVIFRILRCRTRLTLFIMVIAFKQLLLMASFSTFLVLPKFFSDLLDLDRPQILAILDESRHIVSTAHVNVLQNVHSKVSKLFIFLRQVVLNHSEHVLQIDVIQ